MNTLFFISNIATVALVAVFVAITPALNRKSLLFGVRVPEYAAGLPESRRLKRNYAVISMLGCLAVLGISVLQYVLAPEWSLLALLYFPFVMIGVQFAAFIPQWRKAKELKEGRGWAVPQTASAETRSAAEREKLSSLPWGWYIASAALVTAVTLWALAMYPKIDQIILHWDFDMQPTQVEEKSLGSLLLMPLCALSTVAILAGSNAVMYRQKLQISAESPALSFAQHKLYRRMISNALGFMTVCITAMFAVLQVAALDMYALPPALIPATIIGTMALGMLPVLYVPIRAGQGGCKLKPTVDPTDALSEDLAAQVKVAHPGRGDDQYWKLGMFYYNPDDPAVLIEDRFGGNGGFNYARLPAKVFVAVIAAVLAASYAAITWAAVKYPFA